MKTKNYLTAMMSAWCYDNASYVIEPGMTYSEYMIAECEATDWNWFMEDDKIDNYTEKDIQEIKSFLEDWNYLPNKE